VARTSSLKYTAVAADDPSKPILDAISGRIRNYIVTYLQVASGLRRVYGQYRNFTQAYRACRELGGSAPRCFLRATSATWLSVDQVEMPH